MGELVFFTTNRVKLAHFKYIGEKFDVEVSGFRERTFYASYHEPRIRDREKLLRESYLSALEQWKKRKHSLDDIFFFEDTSVRINALSDREDYPGVDVKYWMKGMTFRKLDRVIEEAGGDRSVVVRSDIIAHLPESIRTVYNISDPFLWVFSEQEGSIATEQRKLDTNIVFPWLDNKTFNRWFVPLGCEVPISALDVSEADLYDFRLKAFSELISEFRRFGMRFLPKARAGTQLALPGIVERPVYIVCGFSCAGKSTLAESLARSHGFLHLEASDFMYQQFWQRHGVSSKLKIGDFAERALEQIPSIVSKQVAHIANQAKVPVVVTGFRSPKEIEDLRSRLQDFSVYTIFVEANKSIRFNRAVARNRESITAEKFGKRERQERRMGLDNIRSLNGAVPLMNERSIPEFVGSFLETFRSVGWHKFVEKHDPIRMGNLEKAIIQALASRDARCFGDEEDCWYTTTEIAGLISGVYGVKKSKNNVSRYFNQGFHPYYELKRENNRFLCRLSNTGVGVAILLGRGPRFLEQGAQKRVQRNYDLF